MEQRQQFWAGMGQFIAPKSAKIGFTQRSAPIPPITYKRDILLVINQERKLLTRTLFFGGDNSGKVLAFGSPKSGNHHDLNEIQTILNETLGHLEKAKIQHKGLFLNTNAGFDSKKIR